ncbi:D-amino-acid transaminase [Fictibacillus sp. Mic-4]|uniref:D-amino-acid transaminase n=1 Tax=Fictibacillus sp. Mic-4 TaxID=3132826 RepID=UPI003CF1888B
MQEYVLYNDAVINRENAAIDMEDRGYLFGDGIYEVMFVYNGRPFAVQEHFTRFQNSARKLEMNQPFTNGQFAELTNELIEKNNIINGIVYIQMTRGKGPRNHLYERDAEAIVTGFAREMNPPKEAQVKGIRALLTEDIRWLRCDIKSLNLLGNTMAKRKAADYSCAEALMHRDGICTEGSSSNLFIVKNNVLQTHPANHYILNGITRQFVLDIVKELKLNVREEAFTIEELAGADEVFITSTTMEITPVVSIEGDIASEYKIGKVTRLLQEKLKEKIGALCHMK